jgi:hypothetical protein
MKKQLMKMTALAGLITSLVLAVAGEGQSAPVHSVTSASGEAWTATSTVEIEWP